MALPLGADWGRGQIGGGFDDIKALGARFYRYQGGFLHGKFMLMDNQIATVGTANFDSPGMVCGLKSS